SVQVDTTRADEEFSGAEAVDLLVPVGRDPSAVGDFKGNMDIPALEKLIEEKGARSIPLIMLTITNNAGGGQPVSMENMRQAREVASRYQIPFFLDACRAAENAFFRHQREKGERNKEEREIAV